MVISGATKEGERVQKFMAMPPERLKPLHNFSMPRLKWANQRFLRCMKVNSNGEVPAVDRRSSASDADKASIGRRRESDSEKRGSLNRPETFKKSPSQVPPVGISRRKSRIDSDRDDGIEAIRAKLMFDLQTAADKMEVAILREGEEDAAAAERPWNLRTRRAACKAPNGSGGGSGGGGGKSLKIEERRPNFSPLRTESKSPRLRGGAAVAASGVEKKERAKFLVSLSRREIEEDFMAMVGDRPSRRPKKRAKIVQKQLDSLFPGLWLSEITADSYKVSDFPDSGKRS